MIKLINFTGNIGCGKTTKIAIVKEKILGSKGYYLSSGFLVYEDNLIEFLKEPVAINPYLERFYENKKKYAYQMENFMIKYFYDSIKEIVIRYKKENNPLDLVIYTDYGWPIVFIENLFVNGFLDVHEYHACKELNSIFIEKFLVTIFDKIEINYIMASTENCISNIKKRARNCETVVDIDFLVALEAHYNYEISLIENAKKVAKSCDKVMVGRIPYIPEKEILTNRAN